MLRTFLLFALFFLPLTTPLFAGEPLKSGPEVGTKEVPAFLCLHCSGPQKGESACLVCDAGDKPAAMIFARGWSKPLTQLVKKIEDVNAKQGDKMSSFVVVLQNDDETQQMLTSLAKTETLKHTVLAVYDVAGPTGYTIPFEADVTVVLYVKTNVRANHVFREGELNAKGIDRVLADLPKILAEK
jgi:hypothetical protein